MRIIRCFFLVLAVLFLSGCMTCSVRFAGQSLKHWTSVPVYPATLCDYGILGYLATEGGFHWQNAVAVTIALPLVLVDLPFSLASDTLLLPYDLAQMDMLDPVENLPSLSDPYIPKDLDDCFVQLEEILTPKDIKRIGKFQRGAEGHMSEHYSELDMWMRDNWGLSQNSRLAEWFKTQWIERPEDMSRIILISFRRHLNREPIELDKQLKNYTSYLMKRTADQPSDSGEKN